MGVAVLLSAIAYVIMLRDFNAGLAALTSMALFFLPVLFTLWAAVGWLIRRRPASMRLLANLAITTVVIAAITAYISNAFNGHLNKADQDGLTLWYYMVLTLWASCVTGGIITFRFLVRQPQPSKK